MSSMTPFMERAVLDHIVGKSTEPPPVAAFAGLLQETPSEASGGTGVEADYEGYLRIEITPDDFGEAVSASGLTTLRNSSPIQFPMNLGTNAQTVVAVGLYDAATDGNLLLYLDIAGGGIVLNRNDSYAPPANSLILSAD